MATLEQHLRSMYAAFNARDIDGALAMTAPDIDWPNGWEGGRVVGHGAVRDYWTRQWAAIDPRVEPVSIVTGANGRIEVEVHQLVKDLDGDLIADGTVYHVYTVRDGLLARMDIEER